MTYEALGIRNESATSLQILTMAGVRTTPQGTFQVLHRDPIGRQHSKTFERKTDANRYRTTVETDKLRGDWLPRATGVDIWHINSDEARFVDYNTEFTRAGTTGPTPTARRITTPCWSAWSSAPERAPELPAWLGSPNDAAVHEAPPPVPSAATTCRGSDGRVHQEPERVRALFIRWHLADNPVDIRPP